MFYAKDELAEVRFQTFKVTAQVNLSVPVAYISIIFEHKSLASAQEKSGAKAALVHKTEIMKRVAKSARA